MIASRCLVVGVKVRYKLRRVLRQRIDYAARKHVAAVFIVFGAPRVQCSSLLKACLLGIFGVK